ncbi:MAG: hypothetical protein GY696_33510 [Gammaproteobacteria bacterium]|nr:hypothetical protein [Gammaproteobacteria bacterium]
MLRGRTGCGKTSVLNALASQGHQILDLERLARHRGSAFGDLGMPEQPSAVEFIQRLQERITIMDSDRPMFVEFSGDYLGSLTIPPVLARRIDRADWLQLQASEAQRVSSIISTYANVGTKRLLSAIKRLRERFSAESFARIRKAIRQQRLEDAVQLLLPYYDVAYDHQMATASGLCLFTLDVEGYSLGEVAQAILAELKKIQEDSTHA